MGTKWRDAPLTDFVIHKMAESEEGEETGETYLVFRRGTGDQIKTELT